MSDFLREINPRKAGRVYSDPWKSTRHRLSLCTEEEGMFLISLWRPISAPRVGPGHRRSSIAQCMPGYTSLFIGTDGRASSRTQKSTFALGAMATSLPRCTPPTSCVTMVRFRENDI